VAERLACLSCGKRVRRERVCRSCRRAPLRGAGTRFDLRDCLAVDETSVLYRAIDKTDRSTVAVRVVRPNARTLDRERVVAEARVLHALHGTDGLPRFVYAGTLHTTQTEYWAYEYIEGEPLPKALRRQRASRVLDQFLHVLDAAAVLHKAKWVHCALTPRHVMVNRNGEVRLVDLRCARHSGSLSHGLGARGFRAPEQYVQTAPVTPATDVFALACTFYQLLTGLLPYPPGRGDRVFPRCTPIPLSEVTSRLTADVDDVVMQALSLVPEARYADAGAFREALWRHVAGATVVDVDGPARLPFWQRWRA